MVATESAENYLEAILVLSKEKPVVRSVDVSNHTGFRKSSISIAMKNLKAEGYITNYSVEGEGIEKKMVITLKYGANKARVINGIKRISKPGLRVYARANELPRVLNGLGIAIISTSEGMMTDREARKKHTGGEVVAYVW